MKRFLLNTFVLLMIPLFLLTSIACMLLAVAALLAGEWTYFLLFFPSMLLAASITGGFKAIHNMRLVDVICRN